MKRNHAIYALCALVAGSVWLYALAASSPNLRGQAVFFQTITAGLFVIYIAAAWLILSAGPATKNLIGLAVLAAVLFRLLMAFSAPTLSNDIYRYAWDGRVQAAGISPYKYVPNDPALAKLRKNSEYKQLKDNIRAKGVYQPAAQILFLASAPFGKHAPLAIKIVLALLDSATVFLLLGILKRLKRPPGLIVLYAWCPLAVFEIAGSGHIDGLAVFFLTAAVYLAVRQRRFMAGVLIGAAAATKLYPIALLPAVMRDKWDWRTALGAATGLIALYIPYIKAGGGLLPFANGTSGGPSFNPGLKSLMILMNGSQTPGVDNAYSILALAAAAGLTIYIWAQKKDGDGIVRSCFLMAAGIMVLLPYTVPWYLVLVLPFAAAELSVSFIWLAGTIMLTYLYYSQSPWALPPWVPPLEFIPFFLLLIFELRAGLRDKPLPLYRLLYTEPRRHSE